MILVLLTRFCKSVESDAGFKLCQGLVKKGHDLFVTSISIGEAMERETCYAKKMNMEEKGSITLLHPDYDDCEVPESHWLTTSHEKYFSYLSKLDDVNVIIGTLPGTEKTSVELAQILKSNLILMAPAQISSNEKYLEELKRMVEQVDEFWSIGSNVHSHNDALLSAAASRKHKEIFSGASQFAFQSNSQFAFTMN